MRRIVRQQSVQRRRYIFYCRRHTLGARLVEGQELRLQVEVPSNLPLRDETEHQARLQFGTVDTRQVGEIPSHIETDVKTLAGELVAEQDPNST